jgi:hypothetical protein
MRPSSASTRSEGALVTAPLLRSLHLQLERPSGPLRTAIEAALASHGSPLRWAITAADEQHLEIEAVVVGEADGIRQSRA